MLDSPTTRRIRHSSRTLSFLPRLTARRLWTPSFLGLLQRARAPLRCVRLVVGLRPDAPPTEAEQPLADLLWCRLCRHSWWTVDGASAARRGVVALLVATHLRLRVTAVDSD